MLAIQAACNNEGLKIPWAKVGQYLIDQKSGLSVSEGAITQHLSKLRTALIKDGVPVPPPLKRGGKLQLTTTNTKGQGETGGDMVAPKRVLRVSTSHSDHTLKC